MSFDFPFVILFRVQ